MALPPPDLHGDSSDPFSAPTPEALHIIQTTAQHVLKEWQDTRIAEAVSGSYGN